MPSEREALPPDVRRLEILAKVRRDGGASISELAKDYAVSLVTVHRDLEVLANDGLVTRIFGGVRALDMEINTVESDFMKRARLNPAGKYVIAAQAIKQIVDGSTIFIDHSTTCHALARQLERNPPNALTVVTNSPAIAYELHETSIHLIVTPGEVDQVMRTISGGWTEEFVSHLNFAVAFVSAAGLSLERGLTTTRHSLAGTLRAAHQAAKRTVALIDSTKVGKESLLTIFRAEDVDEIITDDQISAEAQAEFRAAGINLVVAEAAPALARVPNT